MVEDNEVKPVEVPVEAPAVEAPAVEAPKVEDVPAAEPVVEDEGVDVAEGEDEFSEYDDEEDDLGDDCDCDCDEEE